LTDAASIIFNVTSGHSAEVTITANRALAAPSNSADGQVYTLIVNQDGVGSHTLTFNAAYNFPGGSAPVITAAANSVDMFQIVVDGANFNVITLGQDIQ